MTTVQITLPDQLAQEAEQADYCRLSHWRNCFAGN